ncbi:hypothetical protein PAL_GLEAN10018774 [Pteropus alecto]|uniref:Uncharacterized protein n=1 Tax=Pteropus alecto TaxID=9402 RepID=L5L2K7_PTEAL|nr:hypothetical protein PAL_GLEAN10018774 [Pteropus alecto]
MARVVFTLEAPGGHSRFPQLCIWAAANHRFCQLWCLLYPRVFLLVSVLSSQGKEGNMIARRLEDYGRAVTTAAPSHQATLYP